MDKRKSESIVAQKYDGSNQKGNLRNHNFS